MEAAATPRRRWPRRSKIGPSWPTLSDTPDDYTSYLAFLFGERMAEEVRGGAAGKRVNNHTMGHYVDALLKR